MVYSQLTCQIALAVAGSIAAGPQIYNRKPKEANMATPAFMLQRQQNFHFDRDDPIVQYYLDESDIDAVRVWQRQQTYTFEFHEMHDTGNPIYIRADGNTDQSLITKIDTKSIGDPAQHYKDARNLRKPWIENIPNFAKISRLGAPSITEITNIVTHEWPRLQKLAARRWSGWRKPAPPKTLIERALESGQYPPPPLKFK